MTRHNRPTAIQTTLAGLGSALNDIYRTAGYRAPERLVLTPEEERRAALYDDYQNALGEGQQVGTWDEYLEGSTPVDDGEPSPHPDLVNDTTRAIEAGFYDEYEPEEDDE